jgi:hypothetical protein
MCGACAGLDICVSTPLRLAVSRPFNH